MAQHTDPVPWPARRAPATRLDPIFLTVAEVARLLSLHTNTVYRWAAEGSLPSIRLGHGAVRIPRTEFYQWVRAQQRAGSPMQTSNPDKRTTA